MPAIETGMVRTFTGNMVNVFNPHPATICIEDIAHALSNICRFGGHTRSFYSVAEHSLRVARIVEHKHALAGLLHDASEAYLVDLPTPVKMAMPKYYEAEYRLMEVIALKFGFTYPLKKAVAKADRLLLETEWMELMADGAGYTPLSPLEARARFLEYFDCIEF